MTFPYTQNSGTPRSVRLLGVPVFYRFLGFLKKFWYTLENETLGCTRILLVSLDSKKFWYILVGATLRCTRVFIGFLWIFEKTGTLESVRLLCVPGFYGVLWILEKIWYTLESEILRCTRSLWGSLDFQKYLVHFGE